MPGGVVFVVVGRLGENLTQSKVEPIVHARGVSRVVVFRRGPGRAMDRVSYVVSPRWARAIKPLTFLYELLQLLAAALRVRPRTINGVYTLPCGLFSTLAARLSGARSIVSVIGGPVEIDTYFRPRRLWKGLNLWMLRACDRVTTKGRAVTAYLTENGIAPGKIFEFNGSIDTRRFTHDDSVVRDIDLLFVGYFTELKGPDRVLSVYRQLKTSLPGLRAAFLGEGQMRRSIQDEVERESWTDDILFPGHVSDTEAWFRRSKLLLMPSRTEGLSTAMLEAMACGCVPIVSNVGNMTDAAWDGENAYVVDDYRDVAGFQNAAMKLLDNEAARERMARNGERMVRERYSIEAQTRIFEAMVEGIQ